VKNTGFFFALILFSDRSIDLRGSYDLKMDYIYSYMKDSTRCTFITSVNLTSCYWIPSAFIKKSLIRLKNLETLLVADTKLTNSDLKALLTALPKVRNKRYISVG